MIGRKTSSLRGERECEKIFEIRIFHSQGSARKSFASEKWKMTWNYVKVSPKMLFRSWWESSLPIFILVWENQCFSGFFPTLSKKRYFFDISGEGSCIPIDHGPVALLPRARAPIWWPLRLMGPIPTRLMRSRLLWRFTVPAKRMFSFAFFHFIPPQDSLQRSRFQSFAVHRRLNPYPLIPRLLWSLRPSTRFFSGAFLYFVWQTIHDPPFTTPRVIIGQGRGGEESHSGEGV